MGGHSSCREDEPKEWWYLPIGSVHVQEHRRGLPERAVPSTRR